MTITRRDFLFGAAVTAGLPRRLSAPAALVRSPQDASALFQHGVASGDPLTDRVVLWTRVTPPPARSATGPIETTWEIAADERLTRIVAAGTGLASSDRDFTVKIDAPGLQPGRVYYYAFTAGGQRSAVGRTRTLAAGSISRVRLAVVSCSNYVAGYFNAYRCVANRPDIDIVLHLGDYIYESAEAPYEDRSGSGRAPLAAGEAATLAEYRRLYATYHTDPDLQEAHRQHPFVVAWDDHEIANNAWAGGAEHHTAAQGAWPARLAAAYQAYTEWLPIRESAGGRMQVYRSFRVGDLTDVMVLDARSRRDRQVATASARELNDVGRTLLGKEQEMWLFDRLRASVRAGTRWRLVGQQTLFSSVTGGSGPLSPDMWDGYPAARNRVIDFLRGEQVRDLAILSGDLHSSWALDVPSDPWAAAGSTLRRSLAVEAVTPAISSPPLFTEDTIRARVTELRGGAPHLRFVEGDNNGYVLLDLTPQRLQADWYFVPTVMERTERERRAAAFVCERGSGRFMAV
jgi:alkaline phosphatase D